VSAGKVWVTLNSDECSVASPGTLAERRRVLPGCGLVTKSDRFVPSVAAFGYVKRQGFRRASVHPAPPELEHPLLNGSYRSVNPE